MANNAPQESIAIIGYGYKLPGGLTSDEDLWHLIAARRNVQVPVASRYGKGLEALDNIIGNYKLRSPYEGLITNNAELKFDTALFSISNAEAKYMDPQQRMLLMTTWEALEHAGINIMHPSATNTGVYIGAQLPAATRWILDSGANEFVNMGTTVCMLANRLSYHFNFQGPSTSYCTACSSGLTALHAAITSLRANECRMAIFGAVSYLGSPYISATFSQLGVISPTGTCRSFDNHANGYMRAEGAFTFVLKKLSDAERDGNKIYAVIRATYCNSAGTDTSVSDLYPGRYITAPTVSGQINLLNTTYAQAKIAPEEIDYLEAHATGTIVGDSVEGLTISQFFRRQHKIPALRVASTRSNLGHLEAASFTSSLLKTILMLNRRSFLPISKTFSQLNIEIPFLENNIKIQTTCESFPNHPIKIGINSFGYGGTNGHCIVEEYQPTHRLAFSSPNVASAKKIYLIPLSARNKESLPEVVQQLSKTLQRNKIDIYTLAANLSKYKTHFSTRTAVIATSTAELIKSLDSFSIKEDLAHAVVKKHRITFIFPGVGSQWPKCGQALYHSEPIFKDTIDKIEAEWLVLTNWSLKAVAFESEQAQLDRCDYGQPVTFMLQIALVELLKTWGVHADSVVGHSAGEVAAAYTCGALNLSEACQLIFTRSQLQQKTSGLGRLLVIGLSKNDTINLLNEYSNVNFDDTFNIVCENSPINTVVCGRENALQHLIAYLTKNNIFHKLVPGSTPYHSHAMETIKADLLDSLAYLDNKTFSFSCPMYSTATTKKLEKLDAQYWWQNVRKPVQFMQAVSLLLQERNPDIALEISPTITLKTPFEQCLQKSSNNVTYIPSLLKNGNAAEDFFITLSKLFEHGVILDFDSQFPQPEFIVSQLPKYPINAKEIENAHIDKAIRNENQYQAGPLLGKPVSNTNFLFSNQINLTNYQWLEDHCISNKPILPGACYIEMLIEVFQGAPLTIEALQLLKTFAVEDLGGDITIKLIPSRSNANKFSFEITNPNTDQNNLTTSEVIYCRGQLLTGQPYTKTDIPNNIKAINLDQYSDILAKTCEAAYQRINAPVEQNTYFYYGSHFQVLKNIRQIPGEYRYYYEIEMDKDLWKSHENLGYILHSILIDGGNQAAFISNANYLNFHGIPSRIEGIKFLQKPVSNKLICIFDHGSLHHLADFEKGQPNFPNNEYSIGSIALYDSVTGSLVFHIEKYYLTLMKVTRGNYLDSLSYQLHWQLRQLDLLKTKNFIQKTTKNIDAENFIYNLIDDITFASGTPYYARVLEILDNNDCKPILVPHLNSLQHIEYIIAATDSNYLQKLYEQLFLHTIEIRFVNFLFENFSTATLYQGLLRPNWIDLVILQVPTDNATTVLNKLAKLKYLMVSNGLVIVLGALNEYPDSDWIMLSNHAEYAVLSLNCPSKIPVSFQQLHLSFNNGSPFAAELSQLDDGHLQNSNIIYIENSEEYAQNNKRIYHINLSSKEQIARIFTDNHPVSQIDFWCTHQVSAFATNEFTYLMNILAALIKLNSQKDNSSRLIFWVITQGAMHQVTNPHAATLWGAIRTAAAELTSITNLEFKLVDIGGKEDLPALANLRNTINREQEFVIRDGKVWVSRLLRTKGFASNFTATQDTKRTYALVFDLNSKSSLNLSLKEQQLPSLNDNDVEIDIKASALNFRDVMVALDKLPDLAYEKSFLGRKIGIEASGIIKQIGKKVANLSVGDEVIITSSGLIANRVRINQNYVLKKPNHLSLNEAASVLSAYATAYYALFHVAYAQTNQSILIHSAMGGVGQAAINLAKYLGMKIYATAGTAEKRSALLQRGVAAVFDSHDYNWHSELMVVTQNSGVDVILNSLAGEHITLGLQSLAANGVFCELGKVDIYENNSITLQSFRKNITYRAIDMDRLALDAPQLNRAINETCLQLLSDKKINPLPITKFSIKNYEQAFRYMMAAKHTGKIVLNSLAENETLEIIDEQPLFSTHGTYLITGGLSGFGLCFLAYAVYMGVTNVLVLDHSPERQRTTSWLVDKAYLNRINPQVRVEIVPANVAIFADVKQAIQQIDNLGMPPLIGIFHLAGTLDDQLIPNQTKETYNTVIMPKALGAWNLHKASLDLDCDLNHFILFSSTSSILGNPGQANYSAANAFLDSLISYRTHQNLAGMVFNMAAISDTGMAFRNPEVLRLMKLLGMPALPAKIIIDLIDNALRNQNNCHNGIFLMTKDWKNTAHTNDYSRTGILVNNEQAFITESDQLSQQIILPTIKKKISELTGILQINENEMLSSYGMTSIILSEFLVFLQKKFGYNANAADLLVTATAKSLTEQIIQSQDGNVSFTTETTTPSTKSVLNENSSADFSTEFNASTNKLPDDCAHDLRIMQRFLDKLLKQNTYDQISTPNKPEHVLITGGTGFLGRQLIDEFLHKTKTSKVHCIVRASNDKDAKIRIVAALQEADVWSDDYYEKIHAYAGDINKNLFGLSKQTYQFLTENVTSVYHFAADLNLTSSYVSQRKHYPSMLRNILKFCITSKLKHLHVASTLGIFPAYTCNGALEFSNSVISENKFPDMNEMLRVFPINQHGYIWSKFMTEQILIYAKEKGIPVTLYRLPLTNVSAKTGYTKASDICIRLLFSTLQTGCAPHESISFSLSPSDIVCQLVVRLSLLKNRTHYIYHISNPHYANENIKLISSAYSTPIEVVSYTEFKQRCQAHGSSSPLNLSWILVDHFANYWFQTKRTNSLIDTRHTTEDLRENVYWPSVSSILFSSNLWIQKQGNWPYTSLDPTLNYEKIHFLIRQLANSYDLLINQVFSKSQLQSLEKLTLALQKQQSKLKAERKIALYFQLWRNIYNYLQLYQERQRYPAIASERIDRPIFIIGMYRSGTTFLHRLLASDEKHFMNLFTYEMLASVLDKHEYTTLDLDHRCKEVTALLNRIDTTSILKGVHETGADLPEEDFLLLDYSFRSIALALNYNLTTYHDEILKNSMSEAYAIHKLLLKQFQWQKHQAGTNNTQSRWLLKCPQHTLFLNEIFEKYPDAYFIHLHRDPATVVASFCSLIYRIQASCFADKVDKGILGQMLLRHLTIMDQAALKFRNRHPELETRFLDISYNDLIQSPTEIVKSIFKHVGIGFSQEEEVAFNAWLEAQNKKRNQSKRNLHSYSLEEFGLSTAQVQAAFASGAAVTVL